MWTHRLNNAETWRESYWCKFLEQLKFITSPLITNNPTAPGYLTYKCDCYWSILLTMNECVRKPLIYEPAHPLSMMWCNHSSAVSSPAAGSVPKPPCSTSSTVPSAPLFWWGSNVVWIDRLSVFRWQLLCRHLPPSVQTGAVGWGGGAEGRMLNLNTHNWVYVVKVWHLPLRGATHWIPSVWRILGIHHSGELTRVSENGPSGSTECPAETLL